MPGPIRILLLTANIGSGHPRAAEALAFALKELSLNATVEVADTLEFMPASFRALYRGIYLGLFSKFPPLVGYGYRQLDRASPGARPLQDQLRIAWELSASRRLFALLQKKPWDLIIHTHFLPAEILAAWKRSGKIKTPMATVVTDFFCHRLWIQTPCEHTFVASSDAARRLQEWGVPAAAIHQEGIPIHPVFMKNHLKPAVRAELGLNEKQPVLLQLDGGLGIGPIESIFDALIQIKTPVQLVVITGKNESALRLLEKKTSLLSKHGCPHRVLPLGFISRMRDWMSAADLIITKPGGMTCSEALACGVPMIFPRPVPGQESRNAELLSREGAAVVVPRIQDLTVEAETLLSDPDRLTQMRGTARRLARPEAALNIARILLQTIR